MSAEVGRAKAAIIKCPLKRLDKIAYIRLASVYKSFEDVTEFQDAIAEVGRERKPGSK